MIWLTGNRGMLGQQIELLIKSKNHQVFGTDTELNIGDISALQRELKSKDISLIINCAAYTAVDNAEDDENGAFMVNAVGAENIASLAHEYNCPIMHFSTDYVFDGTAMEGYRENDYTKPIGVYGKSKLAGEIGVRRQTEKHYIIRLSWLFGVRGMNFVYTILRLLGERDEIFVVNDQFGSPTGVRDVAEIAYGFIEQKITQYGIYHFSGEGRISWYEFALKIRDMARDHGLVNRDVVIRPLSTAAYPTRAKRPANSYLFKDKIKALSFPVRKWEDMLNDFFIEIKNTGGMV